MEAVTPHEGRLNARRVFGIVTLVALAWSAYEVVTLNGLSAPLATPAAPRKIISFELAPTATDARTVLRDWNCEASRREPCTDVTPIARDALRYDFRFIAAYVLAWSLLTIWAGRFSGSRPALSRPVVAVFVLIIVGGGLADVIENRQLLAALGAPDGPEFARAMMVARLAAMTKFVLLLVGGAVMLALTGGALRYWFVSRLIARIRSQEGGVGGDTGRLQVDTFHDLIALENDGIFHSPARRPGDTPKVVENHAADEPRVLFRAADVIGLALSGGGIRSATFNLGLLQGLQRLGLLRLFDYVSTVSGGGYVGSFWSEWLARQQQATRDQHPEKGPVDIDEARLFPTVVEEGPMPRSVVDTDEERHLREFSRFLAPRWGFFEVEMWTAIVAVLAGLVPALFIATSVIGVALVLWLALTFPLASTSNWAPVPVLGLTTFVVFYVFEKLWQEFKRDASGAAAMAEAAARRARRAYWAVVVLTIVLVGAFQYRLPSIYQGRFETQVPIYMSAVVGAWSGAPGAGLVKWWAVSGIENPARAWIFSPRLFDYGVAWLAAAFVLLVVRVLRPLVPYDARLTAGERATGMAGGAHHGVVEVVRFLRAPETVAAYDRALSRVIALGVVWSGVAALWHVAINLGAIVGAAVAAVASAGAFAALRNWIGVTLRRPSEAGFLDRLKPVLPQVLAYLTLSLAVIVVGGLLIRVNGVDWFAWWTVTSMMLGVLVLGLFIAPEEFGLHAFYRDRIGRAYAGACNLAAGQGAAENRGTEPRDGDNRLMTELVGRPLHLVCCAANDLSGDQVETLGRGARSAVLSKHGFSIGRHFHRWTPVSVQRLGAAVTASAAAFNSNMGQISVRVGPAVAFLMSALNLRLGLWLRHPAAAAPAPRRWPGVLFYREMGGLTSASGRIVPGRLPNWDLRDVHLSDGAHFENLALYELIRRHCRYVLVSDCGADPTVAFDDLGNVLRRIREDFGVDIQLDVSALRPGPDGRSRQHVAVGTIHYSPTDRGILLYVKPSLTGDEPTDVLQYKTRNTAFPHEGTGDQFYDEAQWESYRRLGLHAAECIFEFVRAESSDATKVSADWVFAEAGHQWGLTPQGLEERVLAMTQRFGALEADLHQRPLRGVLKEVFPEMTQLPSDLLQTYEPREPVGAQRGAAAPPDAETALATELTLLLRVTQLMEDAWLTCHLDTLWSHPLNLGWINLFARWATAPTFRFWWPLLGPMFSPGFRRFVEQRFPMPPDEPNRRALATAHRSEVVPLSNPEDSGLAAIWWKQRSAQPRDWTVREPSAAVPTGRVLCQNRIVLRRPDGDDVRMQVGIAGVTTHHTTAGWTSHDFFVPPSLWGAGIGWRFLNDLMRGLSESFRECYVVVKAPPDHDDHQVARDDARSFIEQYRKAGFRQEVVGRGKGTALDGRLLDALAFRPDRDTLMVLDLTLWKRRQDPDGANRGDA
jgi:hypothetical protein